MSLSYAGVPLIVPTAEAAAWVEARISTQDLFPFNEPTLNQVRNPPTIPGNALRRPVKLGSLYWPRDASRWSVGYFLASSGQLAAIRAQVYGGGYAAQNLILGDGTNQITAPMWMLPPRPLDQLPGQEGMWLLVLVDQRYFWWQKSSGGHVPASFADAYRTLGEALGVAVLFDGIAPAYAAAFPASTLTFRFEPCAPLLDAVASLCGQRIVCDTSGLVEALAPTSSDDRINQNVAQGLPVLAGGRLDLEADGPGVIPGTVLVTFPKVEDGSPASAPATLSATFAGVALPELQAFRPNPLTTHIINSPVIATVTTGTWTNQAALQALTNQLALDFYREAAEADVDTVFAGIAPWTPDGLSDSVEWTYLREAVTTRVQRPPYNPQTPAPLLAVTSGGGGGGGSPVVSAAGVQTTPSVPSGTPTDVFFPGLDFDFTGYGSYVIGDSGNSVVTPGSSTSLYQIKANVIWPGNAGGTYRLVSLTAYLFGPVALTTTYLPPLGTQAVTTTGDWTWYTADGAHFGVRLEQDSGSTLVPTVHFTLTRLGP